MRRRDFLKATTLAAGVAMLDACKRPEERYLVQPVQRPPGYGLPGESVWSPAVCRQCGAGCGIQVRVVDGAAKKIEGLEHHPVNRGGVCALGHSMLQELYNPDRVLGPQRRAAGDQGAFLDASWEEALDAAVAAIGSTPPERLAIVAGDRNGFVGALWRRFAATLGAPPPAFLEPLTVEVERRASAIALGLDDLPYFDIGNSDYVLSIGAPFLDRWHSPVHYTRAVAEMRRGRPGRRGKLVQAEARMSLTAANADEWLPMRPGTEGLLARAIAGVLLADDLVDDGAARRYRRLFPNDAPELDSAAQQCDLPASRLRRIAHELAAAERRVVVAGGAAAAHTGGLFNMVAALGLNVLLDGLGKPGGVHAPASFGLERPLLPADTAPASLGVFRARLRGEAGAPVETLIVAEADPLHALPASWGLRESIENTGTTIALSSFRDDTTLLADIVLPLNNELERFNACSPAAAPGAPVLGLAEPIVEPVGDGRHPGDVIIALATALGGPVAGAFPWSSFARLVEERITADIDRLPGGDVPPAEYIRRTIAAGGIFSTDWESLAPPGPTATSDWNVGDREQPITAPLPPPGQAATSEEPLAGSLAPPGQEAASAVTAPAGSPADDAAYPFALLPFESIKNGDGRGANRPWLQELPDPLSTVMWGGWLELSPADAAALAIADGDQVGIESSVGEVTAAAVIDPAVRPGVVGMPLGYGHADYGRYARDRGANPMSIIDATAVDGTDAPAWAATRVRLRRIGPGRPARAGRSYTRPGEGENIPVGWAPAGAANAAAPAAVSDSDNLPMVSAPPGAINAPPPAAASGSDNLPVVSAPPDAPNAPPPASPGDGGHLPVVSAPRRAAPERLK